MRGPYAKVSQTNKYTPIKMNIPDISERSIKAGLLFRIDSFSKIFIITSRIQNLYTAGIRTLNDRVSKLPDSTIRVRLQHINSGEVIDID